MFPEKRRERRLGVGSSTHENGAFLKGAPDVRHICDIDNRETRVERGSHVAEERWRVRVEGKLMQQVICIDRGICCEVKSANGQERMVSNGNAAIEQPEEGAHC